MVHLAGDAKVVWCAALPARCGESRSTAICASRSVLAGGLRHNQPLLANLCVLPQVIVAAQTHASGAERKRGTNRCAGRPLRPFPVTRARRGRARGRPPAERPRSSPEVALGLAGAARWTPAGVLRPAEEARDDRTSLSICARTLVARRLSEREADDDEDGLEDGLTRNGELPHATQCIGVLKYLHEPTYRPLLPSVQLRQPVHQQRQVPRARPELSPTVHVVVS